MNSSGGGCCKPYFIDDDDDLDSSPSFIVVDELLAPSDVDEVAIIPTWCRQLSVKKIGFLPHLVNLLPTHFVPQQKAAEAARGGVIGIPYKVWSCSPRKTFSRRLFKLSLLKFELQNNFPMLAPLCLWCCSVIIQLGRYSRKSSIVINFTLTRLGQLQNNERESVVLVYHMCYS